MKVVTLIQHHNVHTLEAQKGTPHLPNEQQQTLANFKYQCPIDFMLILRILWAFLLFLFRLSVDVVGTFLPFCVMKNSLLFSTTGRRIYITPVSFHKSDRYKNIELARD